MASTFLEALLKNKIVHTSPNRSSLTAHPKALLSVAASSLSYATLASLHSFARVLLHGGGRGRPRSDRRAFVCAVKGLLFGEPTMNRRSLADPFQSQPRQCLCFFDLRFLIAGTANANSDIHVVLQYVERAADAIACPKCFVTNALDFLRS